MNKLKTLRKENNLTQEELAKKIGVNLRTLQKWENGESSIRTKNAEKLAKHFGVSVGYLLGLSDEALNFQNLGELVEILANSEITNRIRTTISDEGVLKDIEKITEAYSNVESFINNSKKYEKFGQGLIQVDKSYILIIQKLIASDIEFGTKFADVLINYISLDEYDKLIVFDLIQKMANKDN
ncbi:TPA: helix-turn-helix transcriptional regulator [Streptococcus suis]|nr:helix-turn-helix transcriptional regulator [Streptococcus suis]